MISLPNVTPTEAHANTKLWVQ